MFDPCCWLFVVVHLSLALCLSLSSPCSWSVRQPGRNTSPFWTYWPQLHVVWNRLAADSGTWHFESMLNIARSLTMHTTIHTAIHLSSLLVRPSCKAYACKERGSCLRGQLTPAILCYCRLGLTMNHSAVSSETRTPGPHWLPYINTHWLPLCIIIDKSLQQSCIISTQTWGAKRYSTWWRQGKDRNAKSKSKFRLCAVRAIPILSVCQFTAMQKFTKFITKCS